MTDNQKKKNINCAYNIYFYNFVMPWKKMNCSLQYNNNNLNTRIFFISVDGYFLQTRERCPVLSDLNQMTYLSV